MKRSVALLCVLVLLAGSFAVAGDKKAEHKQAMKESFMRGKELFMDASLGTNGKSCNSCHASGGTEMGKMGDTEIPPFMHLGKKYPGHFGMAEKVMTLDQVVNFCIKNAMEGEVLAWDDQRMADLAMYIVWVDAEKKEKPKEGMEHKEHMKEKKEKE